MGETPARCLKRAMSLERVMASRADIFVIIVVNRTNEGGGGRNFLDARALIGWRPKSTD
jgi:hypothetical protein